MERRLTAILAADVVGYSRLMGANESGTLAALETLRTDLVNPKISEHQGRIVKVTGDGMLVEFPSVVNAVACATELQRDMRKRNASVPQDHRIEFRMGVNVGDVIVQGQDIFGDGVNVAARLESIAPVGGITEDIITDLSKVSGLFVVARNTAFTFKGKTVEAPQAAKHLGVNFILEGSVRKAGARVRVTGQLIHGKDGGHVWADRYDRDLTDIFAIQDEITHAIVEQLRVKLLPQEKKSIGQTPTGNVEAYTYYLRGRQFLHRHSKSYYQLARRMFAKAVELDPAYARAYAGIADCDSFLFLHYSAPVEIKGIFETSAKALALESGLAEAHASQALALSLEQRYEEAMAEFEKAIALDPNSFEGHYFYARACFAQGKFERAAALFERAAEIKPDDYQSLCLLIQIYHSLGRDPAAQDAARRGIERAECELTLHPENSRAAYLGAKALVTLGQSDRAKEWLNRSIAIDPEDLLTQYNVACAYTALGDTEAAFDLLERLLPNANHETKAWIKYDS